VAAIAVPATLLVGAGTTTVSGLTAYGIVPSGLELIADATAEPDQYYTITYVVDGSGTIGGVNQSENGVYTQTVLAGENALSVWAVPQTTSDGEWYFVGWSDGSANPYRTDLTVDKNIKVTAKFSQVEDSEFEFEKDESNNLPSVIANSDNNSNNKGSGEEAPGSPSKENGNGDDEGSNDSASGEANMDKNKVIDGDTFYGGSTFDNFKDEAYNEMDDNDDMSDDLEDFVKDYYDSIEK
jgi:hypothetical protein